MHKKMMRFKVQYLTDSWHEIIIQCENACQEDDAWLFTGENRKFLYKIKNVYYVERLEDKICE